MRKFLATAAFVAVAAGLMVPSVASAADDRQLTASVIGSGGRNAGTTRVPRPVSLNVNLFTKDDRVANPFPLGSSQWLATGFIPNAGAFDQVYLPKPIRLNPDLFPGCSQTRIVNNPSLCPRPARNGSGGSVLGTGLAIAQARNCNDPNRPASSPVVQENVQITLYKSSARRNQLIASLRATSPVALNETIVISVANVARSALYSKVLSFTVPAPLLARGNTPGVHNGFCIALRVVRLTVRKAFVFRRISLGGGRIVTVRQYITDSVGCLRQLTPRPARNVYPFRNFVRFTDGFQISGNNFRIVGSDNALTTATCRV